MLVFELEACLSLPLLIDLSIVDDHFLFDFHWLKIQRW